MHIRVIGIGSGIGDDAIGLAVVDWLAGRSLPRRVSFARCRRPLPDLLDALEGADAAVLVDAARGGDPPGRVRELGEREIAALESTSTHALGVREVVRLARQLDRAPERIAWVGIAIGRATPGETLSAPVRAAIPEAGRRVLDALRRFGGPAPAGARHA